MTNPLYNSRGSLRKQSAPKRLAQEPPSGFSSNIMDKLTAERDDVKAMSAFGVFSDADWSTVDQSWANDNHGRSYLACAMQLATIKEYKNLTIVGTFRK